MQKGKCPICNGTNWQNDTPRNSWKYKEVGAKKNAEEDWRKEEEDAYMNETGIYSCGGVIVYANLKLLEPYLGSIY